MNRIYSATYSNVPVYEYNVSGNHVMRRRSDDWINATHILKVAEFDKPARTRILEREVQKGIHEKVQGGYGKYQGTWVPLEEGRALAERNGVLDKLLPIFDFVPGERSPPPAPKHATNTAAKQKVQRTAAAAAAAAAAASVPSRKAAAPKQRNQVDEMSFDGFEAHMNDTLGGTGTPTQASYMSESESEIVHDGPYSTRKRKRDQMDDASQQHPQTMSYEDQQHLLWTDELLDYFMLQNSSNPLPAPPEPPVTIDLNRAVDDKGHTPMHWAAAMGDLNVVQDLLSRGARVDSLALNGETPLMRSVMFTNNWDKQSMPRLVHILYGTVGHKDWFGSTVFHHMAATTCSKSKYQCARYYLESILLKVAEVYNSREICHLLDQQDQNGDTAILLAARNGARKFVRSLMERGASIDVPNHAGETADELIKELNARRRDRSNNIHSSNRAPSSSPMIMGASLLPPSSSQNQNHGQADGIHNHLASGSAAAATAASLLKADAQHRSSAGSSFYRSEAAALLSSQLPTLIASRTEALAAALETELVERENEASEAERLLEQRKRDLESLRLQSAALSDQLAITAGDAEEEQQRAELAALAECSRTLMEVELSHLLASASVDRNNNTATDGGLDGHLQKKARIARDLESAQAETAQLVEEMISMQQDHYRDSSNSSSNDRDMVSVNGDGDRESDKEKKSNLYKRLLYGALGVRAEDVEALLPDMLKELEAAGKEAAEGEEDEEEPANRASAQLQAQHSQTTLAPSDAHLRRQYSSLEYTAATAAAAAASLSPQHHRHYHYQPPSHQHQHHRHTTEGFRSPQAIAAAATAVAPLVSMSSGGAGSGANNNNNNTTGVMRADGLRALG